ncbi:DUF6912 family protein [Angustibacter luteus]|uniref:DUF6912 family protein n=1 Tax=Angustibacter luteus TaxID=658456 RepID=A0ABW1JFX4_9ACTN
MRIYVPTTLVGLQALRGNGFPAPVAAHAVTGELREWYADGDADELEYAANDEAARASLALLRADPAAVRKRVVVAADVPDAAVRPHDGGRSAVSVSVDVLVSAVASLHVDDAEAEADVRQAVEALDAADAGDDDAQFTVDQAAGYELLWYDVSELDDVLELGHRR